MAKRPKQPKAINATTEPPVASSTVASNIPWVASPDAPGVTQPATQDRPHTKVTRSSDAPLSFTDAVRSSDPWTDMFDYSPWSGVNTRQAKPVIRTAPVSALSPVARIKLQTRQAYESIDQIASYENPWDVPDRNGDMIPLTRREAIRARAEQKRRARIQAEIVDANSPWDDPQEADNQSQGPEENTQEAAATHEDAGRTAKPNPARAPSKPSTTWAMKAQDVPVENLSNGVINVIGDGVVMVVDTGISAGNSITSVVKAGARVAPSIATTGLIGVAGAGMVYGYALNLPLAWKII